MSIIADGRVTLRPMEASDVTLRQRAMDSNNDLRDRPFSEEEVAGFTSFVPQRGDYGVVALSGDDVAGVAWVTFGLAHGRSASAQRMPDLVTYVDEAFSDRGIGSELAGVIVQHAREVGLPGVRIAIEETNPARRYYARKGFESTEAETMVLYVRAPISRVAVYCGSARGARGDYWDMAETLGQQLADRGIELVYGGGGVGLMGAVGTAVVDAGGVAYGVMPRELVDREMAHPRLTRLEVVESMAERKTRMEELADAFIALPGGVGTLEEFFQAFTGQTLGQHQKPLALINASGFYQPLVDALQRMVDEGFIQQKYLDSLIVESTIDAVFERLEAWRAPGTKWD